MISGRPYAPADESALLRLVETPLPGWVRLRYAYAKGYAAGEGLKGAHLALSVVEDAARGLCGASTRTTRAVWLDGAVQRVGYLSGLRSFPWARRGFALSRGLRQARAQAADDPSAVDFATVLAGNPGVVGLLTSGRPGLPQCRRAGRLETCVLTPLPGADPSDGALFEDIAAFYRREAPRKPLFPVLEERHPSLRDEDFFCLRRNGRIVGAAAVWSHGDFRRIFVDGYAPAMRAMRPFANAWSRCRGAPLLPSPSDELRCRYLAYALVENDDPALFAELLSCARRRTERANLVLTLHERDLLLPTVAKLHPWRYGSDLLAASFDTYPRPFGGIPHIEAGAL